MGLVQIVITDKPQSVRLDTDCAAAKVLLFPLFIILYQKLNFLLNSVSSWTFYNCVLFLKEVQRLAEGSETFSPHTAQLYRYLGSQVRNRYAILIIYLVADYNISLPLNYLNSECIRFFNVN